MVATIIELTHWNYQNILITKGPSSKHMEYQEFIFSVPSSLVHKSKEPKKKAPDWMQGNIGVQSTYGTHMWADKGRKNPHA
jgi:hypothetical protein